MFKLFKKRKEKGPKTYTFSTVDISCVGDKYVYEVEADSRAEAFRKLVIWFYGEEHIPRGEVQQEHFTVTRPMQDDFHTEGGMPWWFGRLISGGHGKLWLKLEKYAKDNNIKLKDRET